MPNDTYVQNEGTAEGAKYFQDVEISPANLANGDLRERLDWNAFPQVGVRTIPDPTITTITPDEGGVGTSLDVILVGTLFEKGAVVAFSGTGITVNSTSVRPDSYSIKVNITIAGGAAQTARNVTVTLPNGGTVTESGGFTVIA